MNRKAVWIGLTSAALVAGVSVVAVLSRATAQSVEAGSSVRAAEWETGVEHTYAVDMSAQVGGATPLLDLALHAELSLVRASSDSPKVLVGGEAKVQTLRLTTSPESQAALKARLAQPFVVRMESSGRFSGVAFPNADPNDTVDQTARTILRTLLASIQTTRERDQTEWEALETDMTGRYRAQYRKLSATEYTKQKLEYVSITHGADAGASTTIDSYEGRLTFANSFGFHHLTNLTVTEKTHVTGAGTFPRIDSTLSLDLRRVSVRHANRVVPDQLAFSTLDQISKSEVVRSARAEALADTKWQELAQDVDRFEAEGETGKRARAYSNLAAVLRYRPQSVAEAKARILADEDSRYLLIHALGDAGSTEAQAALHELFGKLDGDLTSEKNVIYALSMVETPTRDTNRFLQKLMDDEVHGRQARFGVGTNAYYARERDPELTESATTELARRLLAAEDSGDIESFIRALGNSADPKTFGLVQDFLIDGRAAIRVAAVDSLRRVPGGQVDAAIARVLVEDRQDAVRRAAVDTLDYRTPTPVLVYTVSDRLVQEPSEAVRIRLARRALEWVDKAPNLRTVLTKLANDDPSAKVREIAARAEQTR